MTVETIEFILPSGNKCEVLLTELNHGVVSLQPTVTLNDSRVPHECFQEIIDHIISLDKDYIKSVYYETFKFNYRFISFNLFGHIRGALRKELRTPVSYDDLVSGKDTYRWIEPGFLPRITSETEDIMSYSEKKVRLLHLGYKNGKIDGIRFKLSETYETLYNYMYDLHPTDLVPMFEVYLKMSITFPEQTPNTDRDTVIHKLKRFFMEYDVHISFV